MLIVSMRDRRLLTLADGELSERADLSALARCHCNDMVIDAAGRAYVGNFGFDLDAGDEVVATELILVLPDGGAQVVAHDMMFPNGSVITPDGKTLIVGETFAARLTAFDIESDGTLTGRRVWAELSNAVPDGICLDEDGACWVASPISNDFTRVAEGGRVLDRIECEQMAIACMLGGPDGKTLFCLTAPATHHEQTQELRGGKIYTCQVPVGHAGRP